ncbi:MAG: glucose 1-dehydrogenase [Actinomycetota bacterium]
MARLEGRTIIITGAAQGQGAAEARACAAEGATVAVTDVDDERGRRVAEEVGGSYFHLDVSDDAQWAEVVAEVERRHGPVSGLVNNAGIFAAQTIADGELDATRRIWEINQLGPWIGMRRVAPSMTSAGGGSIVNISSIAAMGGYPAAAYGASKWAVRGMTKSAAKEFAAMGIRVNSIHPGLIETAMTAQTPPDRLTELEAAIPLGRIGQPDDVVGPVVFLLSDEAAYVTGAELVVDGGLIA